MRNKRTLLFWFVLVTAATTNAHADTPIRTIILVRHGAYHEEAADNDHAMLTALGTAQARLVATRLRALPEAPAEFVTSTLTRAEETAAIIGAAIPPVPLVRTDLLRECTPSVLPDVKIDPDEMADIPRCEKQLNTAFATYFKPSAASETDILVCHGNVIRYFVTKVLGVDSRLWTRFSLAHTSITEIEVLANGSMRLIAVGDVGHLPPNLQSGAGQQVPNLEPPAVAP